MTFSFACYTWVVLVIWCAYENKESTYHSNTFFIDLTTNIGVPPREHSISSGIGLIDSSFRQYSSSITLTPQKFTGNDLQDQTAPNTTSRSNMTHLPIILHSNIAPRQPAIASNKSLPGTSSTSTNSTPLVLTVLLLIISASLAVLREPTTKIWIMFMILVFSHLTCSALFIPRQISTGSEYTCALSDEKTVKCFGYNKYGQLGYSDTNNRGDEADQMGNFLHTIDLGTNFSPTEISVGDSHTCALSENNKVKCWGYNLFGQLGLGDTNNKGDAAGQMGDNLTTIDLGTNFIPTQLWAGGTQTCALSSTNAVKCWGRIYHRLGYGNAAGEMGDNLTTIDLGTSFIPTQLSAGGSHTCALSSNNTMKCWGKNLDGELGYEDTETRGDDPNEMGDNLTTIDLGRDFIPTQISAGYGHTCALSSNKTVKCFGTGYWGQLGHGHYYNIGDGVGEMGDALNTIDLGTNFIPTQITAGGEHTCALSSNKTVKCWGYNAYGQLGLGDTENRGLGVALGGEMGDALYTADLGTNFI
eukprot:698456_1